MLKSVPLLLVFAVIAASVLAQDAGPAAAENGERSRPDMIVLKSVPASFNGTAYTATLRVRFEWRPDAPPDAFADNHGWNLQRRAHLYNNGWLISQIEVVLRPHSKMVEPEIVAWRRSFYPVPFYGGGSVTLFDLVADPQDEGLFLLTCGISSQSRQEWYSVYAISPATPSRATVRRWSPDPEAADSASLDPLWTEPVTGDSNNMFVMERPLSTYLRGWDSLTHAPVSIEGKVEGESLRIEGRMPDPWPAWIVFPPPTDVPVVVVYDILHGSWTDQSDERYHLRGTQRFIDIRDADGTSIVFRGEPPPLGRYRERRYTDEVPGATPLPPELEEVVNNWKREERAKDRALFLAADQERAAARAIFLATWPEYEALQAVPESEKSAAQRAFLEKWFPTELAEYEREKAERDNQPPSPEEGSGPSATDEGAIAQGRAGTPSEPADRVVAAPNNVGHILSAAPEGAVSEFPWLLAVVPAAVILLFTGAVFVLGARRRRSAS